NDVATLVDALLDKRAFDAVIFRDIRIQVGRLCLDHRTYSILTRNLYRWFRELYAKTTKLLNQKLGTLIVRRRTPVTGGLTVVLLGVDGSGKSTHVKQLIKWLGWKLDVGYVYFGSGDGPVSLFRWPLTCFAKNRTFSKTKLAAASGHRRSGRSNIRNFLQRVFRAVWAISLVMEKRSRLLKVVRARNKGMIVVCDRYPQNQFAGFNDGPLLADWLDLSWPWAAIARYEKNSFSMF